MKEKYFSDRNLDVKKVQEQIEEKKKEIQNLLSQTRNRIEEVKLETDQKKLKTLELQKQKLDQQEFVKDSISRDVDELNLEKEILSSITSENKKILENTKKEISLRQKEIENNLSLNLKNMSIREKNLFAEEAKIKLDVFETLGDVKEKVEKQKLEEDLENLKQEIIRKEDVSSLLSDTIDKIENNEISEAENYNAYLESEINFREKLTNETLSLAEKKEFLAEEKEDLIERLEHVKSEKLKKIYQIRENAVEQQMKIILLEGKEDLENNIFSLKYEIKNLNYEKELSERKEDLAKFQSDNLKKELNLRKREIELLKNIRLKVLTKERIDLKRETQEAVKDIIQKVEDAERHRDIREKMDNMLDTIENNAIVEEEARKKISQILDKIENQEIKEAAKEKVNFILDKIDLDEKAADKKNFQAAKNSLNSILDKIENEQIKKDVEQKLDEILDDVELEDIDFLEEGDEFDSFLSDVKKHLSGEKKMEQFNQFSKIPEILSEERKEDLKLKMDENIEMKDRSKRIGPEDYEVGETSFGDYDYNLFVNSIENPEMREKVKLVLDKEDGFDKPEEKTQKMKNAFRKGVTDLWANDQLDLDYWDGNIILDERAKFLYEQKVNNLNGALTDYDLHIDPTDLKVRNFLDIKLTETHSEKRGEINGYKYNGEKIITRSVSRNFYFNYLKKPAVCQKFIDELKSTINETAKSQIANESYMEGKALKDCALEYIGELREEQSYQIDSARNGEEMKKALREVNDMDKEIKNIKNNLPFKMRLKIFKRTISWRFTKLLRFLWKHKGKGLFGIGSILLSLTLYFLGDLKTIKIVHNLKQGLASIKQYSQDVHDMGKRIIQTVQSIYRVPGSILGYVLILLSVFLRILYFFTRMSGTYSSSAVFGALGFTFEALILFDGSAEKINEKVADAMEETGNFVENTGIRVQKYVAKNSPKWYWDKPTKEKSILQIVESGAIKMLLSGARKTETAGKKIEEASSWVRESMIYLKVFVILFALFLAIILVRNYLK